ncbi:MAG: ABC transporter permease [Nitrospirae bacterium]|nr:ABC transporter permease [Nitrospirota bacterium]
MRTLLYSYDAALQNLWREKWINLLAALSISTVMLILAAFLILTANIESFTNKYFNDFRIIVYMDEGIGKDEEDRLKTLFRQDSDISSVKHISKEDALAELQKALGTDNSLLESVDSNPLPSSFELKLKRGALRPALVKQKAAMILQIPGVDDVQSGEKWLASFVRITRALRAFALITGSALFTAVIFISFSTIKILFSRRKEEKNNLKMPDATRGSIRLTFLLEGIIIGTLGGAVCSSVILFSYPAITSKLIELLPETGTSLFHLPLDMLLFGPIAGALLSLTGSFIAVGKNKY